MKKFKEGKFYRHPNTLDIDIFVMTVIHDDGFVADLRVKYWNRHMLMSQGDIEHITINSENYDKWTERRDGR